METTVAKITFEELARKLSTAEIMHVNGTPYNIGYVQDDAYSKGDDVTELFIVLADTPYREDYSIRRSDNEEIECGVDGRTYNIYFSMGCDGEPEQADVELFTLARI